MSIQSFTTQILQHEQKEISHARCNTRTCIEITFGKLKSKINCVASKFFSLALSQPVEKKKIHFKSMKHQVIFIYLYLYFLFNLSQVPQIICMLTLTAITHYMFKKILKSYDAPYDDKMWLLCFLNT